jgi:hypothetical protein
MKDRILQILEAISYEDDKEDFANQFISAVQINVVAHFLQTLPKEQQEKIEKDFEENPDPEQFITLFKSLFPEEEIEKTFKEAMIDAVKKWIEAIQSTLSEEQKEKVKTISDTI